MSINSDGPVLRSQSPAVIPTDPAASGPQGQFSNFGGVARYQVDGGQAEQAPGQRLAPNVGSGIMRSTTSTDPVTGQRTTVNDVLGDVQRGSTESAPSTAPKFHTSGGRALIGGEITPNSLVTIDGVTTSVRAALHAGLIVQNDHGVFTSASGATASTEKTPAQQLEEANTQRRAAEEQATKDSVPQVEALDAESEAIMSEATQKIGNLDSAAAIQDILDTGAISEDVSNRLATSLGVSREEADARVNTLKAAFHAQASAAVGNGAAAHVFEWANEAAPKELRAAVLKQVNQGTTTGYKALAIKFYETLADSPKGRDLILNSRDALARGVSVDQRTGKVYVTLPQVGKVEWKVAVRQGFISPKHG